MYLLDTNFLSELMRRQPNPQVEARFASEPGYFAFTSIGEDFLDPARRVVRWR